MAKRKCYIQNREFIPHVVRITGMNIIDLEWAFERAEILGETCVVEIDMTDAQAEAIDETAQVLRKERSTNG